MVTLKVNGVEHRFDGDPEMPLLWYIRDILGLTGTKFGCGIGMCGACTVHIDGQAQRTCTYPLANAEGVEITTIEGLSESRSHPVQEAWIDADVPQCGYCQSGMIMVSAALLAETPHPSDEDIDTAITNICRCGTYNRVRQAIRRAAEKQSVRKS